MPSRCSADYRHVADFGLGPPWRAPSHKVVDSGEFVDYYTLLIQHCFRKSCAGSLCRADMGEAAEEPEYDCRRAVGVRANGGVNWPAARDMLDQIGSLPQVQSTQTHASTTALQVDSGDLSPGPRRHRGSSSIGHTCSSTGPAHPRKLEQATGDSVATYAMEESL